MRAKNAGDQRENRPDRLMEALRSRELDGGSDFIEEVSQEQAARAPHLFMPGPMLRSPGLHLRSPSLLLLFFSPGPVPCPRRDRTTPQCATARRVPVARHDVRQACFATNRFAC